MNRKFNTRQTDDIVNLTQYLLIFSQRKKNRTHSCLHHVKNPIGQWIILKVHCQVVAKFIRMTNGQFGVQFWHLPTFPLFRPLTWRFAINSKTTIYIINHSVCTLFQTRKKNTIWNLFWRARNSSVHHKMHAHIPPSLVFTIQTFESCKQLSQQIEAKQHNRFEQINKMSREINFTCVSDLHTEKLRLIVGKLRLIYMIVFVLTCKKKKYFGILRISTFFHFVDRITKQFFAHFYLD